jgi:hypothetical protein
MLTFEVVNFDIGYNCILGRHFLLKFMAVIHTVYTTIKMHRRKGMITIKTNQRHALACENATLTHAGRFDEKAAQEQSAKFTKTQGDITQLKSPVPKPLITSSPRPPSVKKDTYVASSSTQQPTDQLADDKKKE